EKKTIRVTHEDSIVMSITVSVGKIMRVLLRKLDGRVKSAPFVLSEKEWNSLVNRIPNISGHLCQLDRDKDSANERIRIMLTSSTLPDSNGYDRLVEEVAAYMRERQYSV